MIQDVYYGDYKTHIYLKTAQDFLELKNGARTPVDPAMEGIIKRVKEGIESAGLTVPALIPADQPKKSEQPAEASEAKPLEPAKTAEAAEPAAP
jgi:hypothetical protein